MHTQHPTTHRLPVIPQGGGGGQRETPRRGQDGSTSQRSWDRWGGGGREVDRVGKGGGTHGRQSPNGQTTHSAPPLPTPQTSPLLWRLRGVNSGTPAACGESVERRADAVASRESPLGHVSRGLELTRGLGLWCELPVPIRREPLGAGSGHKPRRKGGEGTAEQGGGREPGNTADKGRMANDSRLKKRSHPATPSGPLLRDARPSPTPDTPGATTPKGHLWREEALKG